MNLWDTFDHISFTAGEKYYSELYEMSIRYLTGLSLVC